MTPSEEKVLDYITKHYAKFGVSPSNRATADVIGMSRQNVDKIVNKLIVKGYLTKPRKGCLVPVDK